LVAEDDQTRSRLLAHNGVLGLGCAALDTSLVTGESYRITIQMADIALA
jgi:hypothetical protein